MSKNGIVKDKTEGKIDIAHCVFFNGRDTSEGNYGITKN